MTKKKDKSAGESTDNTKKFDIIERNPDSEVLYVGCKDPLAIELIRATLGEKFKIFVLNKEIFNLVTERMISAHIKWEEEQKILEFTRDAEKMHECLKICKKVEDKVGANKWFSLSQFIDETSFTYKHAHSTMDLLFAFGFLAKDIKKNKFMIVADPRVKLKYVEAIEADIRAELEKFDQIKSDIRNGIQQADEALASIHSEKTTPSQQEEGKVIELSNSEKTTEISVESNSNSEDNKSTTPTVEQS